MDQAADKTPPASASYRETLRRHRRLFSLPMLLGAVAAALVLFSAGKSYKSTADLWVDTAPPLPSSISATNGNLAQPPASAAQAILSELLTTKAFAVSVGETALHGKTVGSLSATRAAAASLLGEGQLAETVPGAQVLELSYTGSSPAISESVLAAVVDQLRSYINRSTAAHDQAAVTYTRAQVKVAETAVATARSNVTAYQTQHPGAAPTDPNYMYLQTAEKNAATQLAQANNALSRVTGPSSVDGWSMQVIDPPTAATAPPLSKRKIAEVIVGGGLGGLLVSFLAVVALTPAKKETWEDELPLGGPPTSGLMTSGPLRTGPPLVPTTPTHAAPAGSPVNHNRLSLSSRRLRVPAGPAPTDPE